MKIFLTLAAATLASTAALAQMSAAPSAPPAPTMQPGMAAPAPAAPMEAQPAPMANDMAATPDATASATMPTERDGRWYMGDRLATKAEIKAHKKMMKTPS